MILSLIFTAFFVAVSVSTYECVACGHRDCAPLSCCITPCTIFVAVVIWICAALAVSLSGKRSNRRSWLERPSEGWQGEERGVSRIWAEGTEQGLAERTSSRRICGEGQSEF